MNEIKHISRIKYSEKTAWYQIN